MITPVYSVSDGFYKLLFADELGVEPLLIADRHLSDSPQRIFLVRYVIGESGGRESERPVFKDELTGYDYDSKLTYPTQRVHLDALQSTLEPSMYGPSDAETIRGQIENGSTKEQRAIKAIISETLVASLVGLYGFGW
jgi:hypothetical protein